MDSFLVDKIARLDTLVQDACFIKTQIDRCDLSKDQKKSFLHNDRKQIVAHLHYLITLVSRRVDPTS